MLVAAGLLKEALEFGMVGAAGPAGPVAEAVPETVDVAAVAVVAALACLAAAAAAAVVAAVVDGAAFAGACVVGFEPDAVESYSAASGKSS